MSDFNKYYFEKTFGPLVNYKIKTANEDVPFPFRAWFSSAIGVPIGIVLLLAFIVKAYFSLFYGPELSDFNKNANSPDHVINLNSNSFLENFILVISKFNIFVIGFIVFVGVVLYWIVPSMITYLGQIGLETLLRFKWFFVAIIIAIFGFFIWIIYLRYLLAKRSIDNQFEFEKYKYSLDYQGSNKENLIQIENNQHNKTDKNKLINNNSSQTQIVWQNNNPTSPNNQDNQDNNAK